MALLDAMIRIQPGALGDEGSATQDSLTDGLLHAPEYTRPQLYEGRAVPRVLLADIMLQLRAGAANSGWGDLAEASGFTGPTGAESGTAGIIGRI